MSVYGWFQGKGANGFGFNSTAEEVVQGVDLAGRTVLLTGCNSGLGAETLRVAVARGATVIGAARSLDTARQACAPYGERAIPIACELSEPASVREAVARVKEIGRPLDVVVANAGVMALPTRTVKHGLEMQFLTNHVGHFLLVTGLLDRLTANARVVVLSSGAHHRAYAEGIRLDDLDAAKDYEVWGAYGQAKLANLLFAKHLATRLPAGQTANSVHPGVIATNLGRHMNAVIRGLFYTLGPTLVLKSVPQGTATQCYVAFHPGAASSNGIYFADCNPERTSRHGEDADLAARLWTKTEEIVARLA